MIINLYLIYSSIPSNNFYKPSEVGFNYADLFKEKKGLSRDASYNLIDIIKEIYEAKLNPKEYSD